MADEEKVVHLPQREKDATVGYQNDLAQAAHLIALCCGMTDLEYERTRIDMAKRLKVRPKYLDTRRQIARRMRLQWDGFRRVPWRDVGEAVNVDWEPAFLVAAWLDGKTERWIVVHQNAELEIRSAYLNKTTNSEDPPFEP